MEQSNTKSTLEPAVSGKPCSLWRRLLIMVYDGAIIIAILILAASLPMMLGLGNHTAARDPLYTLYLVTVWFSYLAWCWSRGMTVGMRAWKVRVVNDQGLSPGSGACLVRFGVSLISAAALGLGFAWSLFDPGQRTWHDMASSTRLLQTGG